MATEVPREKLKELIEKNGDGLFQDRDRCEGLLKDYCGGYRREISALVGALEERIPVELKSSWQTAMPPEAMRATREDSGWNTDEPTPISAAPTSRIP